MKVIKENNFPHVFPIKVTCHKVLDEFGFSYGDDVDFCKSELEVVAEDIVAHEWDKYPNYHGTDYGVICPICGQFIEIDKTLIPKKIKENAPKIRINRR